MSVDSIKRPEISNDTYTAAGAGALAGGLGTYGVINARLNHIAKGTTKAFDGSIKDCDTFVKKHNELITKAVESKKGFFGKINKLIGKNVQSQDDLAKKVSESTSKIVDGYREAATKKLGKKLSGEALQEGVDKLSRKKLTKDILKSYKNVTKAGRILAVAGAALIGTVGGCIINRLIKNQNAGSIENKTPEISTNKKPEVLAEITEPLGKTTAEYNNEKKEKKNIEKK